MRPTIPAFDPATIVPERSWEPEALYAPRPIAPSEWPVYPETRDEPESGERPTGGTVIIIDMNDYSETIG